MQRATTARFDDAARAELARYFPTVPPDELSPDEGDAACREPVKHRRPRDTVRPHVSSCWLCRARIDDVEGPP